MLTAEINAFVVNKDLRERVMRVLVELFINDILLATLHLASDIFLVYSYFHEDDPWWAGITLLAIGLPGLLGEYLVFSQVSVSDRQF